MDCAAGYRPCRPDRSNLGLNPEACRSVLVIGAASDGRLFLISDLEPAKIARRFKLWADFHLLVLLGSAWALGWLGQQGKL